MIRRYALAKAYTEGTEIAEKIFGDIRSGKGKICVSPMVTKLGHVAGF